MATGAGTAPVQISERAQHVSEQQAVSKMITAGRVRSSAKWFYWIAGLSMINSLASMSGGNLHFVVGLGVTTVVDAMAKQVGSMGAALDIVINSFVAGLFVLFGYFGCKAHKWAFLVGMALYAADGLLLLSVKDYLSVGFHAYALYAIYRGMSIVDQISAS